MLLSLLLLRGVSSSNHLRKIPAAQVAVIDTYTGKHDATIRVMRHEAGPDATTETMKSQSVHKVNSGWYDVGVKLGSTHSVVQVRQN